MIPFDTRIRAFLHRHCNALEENKSVFFYVDRGGYIGKLDLEKDWCWHRNSALPSPLGDGCTGRVWSWRVWGRRCGIVQVPCGIVEVSYRSHVRATTGRDHWGHRSPRSASAPLKNFQTLLKGLTNVGEDITDPGFIGVRLLIRALKNEIRRATSHYRRYRWLQLLRAIQ